MDIFLLIIIGAIVGILSSFFGIGGGSLIVPILYSLYPDLSSQSVVSISLGTIFFITLINTFRYYKLKLTPRLKVIGLFIISCIIGALIGNEVTTLVDKALSKKIIAAILILTILKLNLKDKTNNEENGEVSSIKLLITGLSGSFISSLTGLGGGIVFTPMLLTFVKLPQKKIAPNSNIAMAVATLIGFIPHLFLTTTTNIEGFSKFLQSGFIGNANLYFVFTLFISAFFTAKIGIKLNDTVSAKNKRLMLSLLLVLLSLKLLLN